MSWKGQWKVITIMFAETKGGDLPCESQNAHPILLAEDISEIIKWKVRVK